MAQTKAKTTESRKAPGFVEPGVLYRLEEAMGRLGWADAAMRTARRNGLKVMYLGNRGYVMGEELIGYISRHAAAEHRSVGN